MRLRLAECLVILAIASGEVLAEEDWCRRVQGGSPGAGNLAVNLSIAHANSRFFGMQSAYSLVDQALAEALDGDRALSVGAEKAVKVYAERLDSVCAVHTRTRELGAARVEMFGDVALVLYPDERFDFLVDAVHQLVNQP